MVIKNKMVLVAIGTFFLVIALASTQAFAAGDWADSSYTNRISINVTCQQSDMNCIYEPTHIFLYNNTDINTVALSNFTDIKLYSNESGTQVEIPFMYYNYSNFTSTHPHQAILFLANSTSTPVDYYLYFGNSSDNTYKYYDCPTYNPCHADAVNKSFFEVMENFEDDVLDASIYGVFDVLTINTTGTTRNGQRYLYAKDQVGGDSSFIWNFEDNNASHLWFGMHMYINTTADRNTFNINDGTGTASYNVQTFFSGYTRSYDGTGWIRHNTGTFTGWVVHNGDLSGTLGNNLEVANTTWIRDSGGTYANNTTARFIRGDPNNYDQFSFGMPSGTGLDISLDDLFLSTQNEFYVYNNLSTLAIGSQESAVVDSDSDGFNSTVDCNDLNATVRPLTNGSLNNINSDILVCKDLYYFAGAGTYLLTQANGITIDFNGSIIDGEDVAVGISTNTRDNVIIKNGIFTDWTTAIDINGGTVNTTVRNNTVSSSTRGVYMISTGTGHLIVNNTFTGNSVDAVGISSTASGQVINNTILSGSTYGISMVNTDSFNITGNNISGNAQGINITSSSSDNNLIYNNWLSNTINAYDPDASSSNQWNTSISAATNIIDGPNLGGNFWADYTGKDSNRDHLGNTLTPYNSSSNIVLGGDNHPLMPITSIPVVTLETANETSTTDKTPTILYNVTDLHQNNVTCTLMFDNGANTSSSTSVSTDSSVSLTPSARSNGIHWYWVTCSDGINTAVSGNNTITIDAQSPTINFEPGTTTANTTLNQNWIFINISAWDNLNIENASLVLEISAGNTTFTNKLDISATNSSWWQNFTGLQTKTYNVNIYVNDSMGNIKSAKETFILQSGSGATGGGGASQPSNETFISQELIQDLVEEVSPLSGFLTALAGTPINLEGGISEIPPSLAFISLLILLVILAAMHEAEQARKERIRKRRVDLSATLR